MQNRWRIPSVLCLQGCLFFAEGARLPLDKIFSNCFSETSSFVNTLAERLLLIISSKFISIPHKNILNIFYKICNAKK